MGIKVLLFGQLTDITKTSELHFSKPSSTQELIQELAEQFPNLVNANYRIAINKKLVQGNAMLADGDVVALLPPFSGG